MCRIAWYLTSWRYPGWGGRAGFNIFTKHWLASSKAKCVNILSQILSQANSSRLLLVLGPRSQFHCQQNSISLRTLSALWTPTSPLHSVLPRAEASCLVPFMGMVAATTAFFATKLWTSTKDQSCSTLPLREAGKLGVPKVRRLEKKLYSHPKLSPPGGARAGLLVHFSGAGTLHLPVLASYLG